MKKGTLKATHIMATIGTALLLTACAAVQNVSAPANGATLDQSNASHVEPGQGAETGQQPHADNRGGGGGGQHGGPPGGISPGSLPTPRPNLTPAEREEVFLAAWDKINQEYPVMDRRKVDWAAVRTKYLPLVADGKDDYEFRALLRQMLAELQDGHVRLAMPDGELAEPALELRQAGDTVVVSAVRPNSDAAQAGLEAGMELVSVDGQSAKATWDRERQITSGSTEHGRDYHSARSLLQGRPDTDVTIEAKALDGTTIKATLKRNVPSRRPPPEFEQKTLANGVLYMRLTSFASLDVTRQMEVALAEAAKINPPGVIIDVRDNGGGQSSVPILSRLFKDPTLLHYTKNLATDELEPWNTTPVDATYTGPVVLLTNPGCASSCEAFAVSLAGTGRAVVVGEPTNGAGLQVWPHLLPYNYAVLVSMPREVMSINQEPVEGKGVSVDHLVPRTQQDWAAGRDPALEKALEVLSAKQ